MISKKNQQPTTSKEIKIITDELVLNLGNEFKEKEEKIKLLETRVWELTKLSQEQRAKIQDYLNDFGSEKELLIELIKTNLELKEATKKKIRDDVIKNREHSDQLRKELIDKLGKEKMIDVEFFLSDCEEWVSLEMEIGKNLDNKSFLIAEQKQKLATQTGDSKEKEKLKEQEITHREQKRKMSYDSLEKKLFETQGQLTAKQEEIDYLREKSFPPIPEGQKETLISQLIAQLKEKQGLAQKEVDNYLKAKKSFLSNRQETIKELQECFNKLEKKFTKQQIIGEIGNTIGNVGGGIAEVITFGIPKAVGEAIKVGSNFKKIKFSRKGSEQFQISLNNELTQFNQTYNSLINNFDTLSLKGKMKEEKEELKLFNVKYKIFDVLIKDGV